MNFSRCEGCDLPPNNTANDLCDAEDYESAYWNIYFLRAEEVIYIAIYIIVFFSGIIGNALVCLVVVRTPSMHTVTNVFIFNLAIADLLVLIIVLIPTMISDVIYTWPFGAVTCPLFFYVQRISVIVSVLTLTAISVERYLAISYPLKYKPTGTQVRTVIILIWVIALVSSVPDLVYVRLEPHCPDVNSVLGTLCTGEQKFGYLVFYYASFFVLPFLIMTAAYGRVARLLWLSPLEQKTDGETATAGKMASTQSLHQRRNVVKMLILVVVFFLACYVLHCFMVFWYRSVGKGVMDSQSFFRHGTRLSHILIYLNSAINPFIYNFMSTKFRKAFLGFSTCCRKNSGFRKKKERLPKTEVTGV